MGGYLQYLSSGPNPGLAPTGYGTLLLKLVIALVVVCLAAYGVLWLVRRKLGAARGAGALVRVLDAGTANERGWALTGKRGQAVVPLTGVAHMQDVTVPDDGDITDDDDDPDTATITAAASNQPALAYPPAAMPRQPTVPSSRTNTARRRASSPSGQCVTGLPDSSTFPPSGRSSPLRHFKRVVLPAPLGPITITSSPADTSSDTPSSSR